MSNELNFKLPNGEPATMSFDPSGSLIIKLATDETPLTVTVESPTKKDSQSWVGGVKKR